MESWMLVKPLTHGGMFVRRIVIDDQVNLLVGRGPFLDHTQELNPLFMTVPRMESIHDLSAAHIHCREQSGRSMALVIVCFGCTVTWRAWQAGLRTGQRLDLTLFVR